VQKVALEDLLDVVQADAAIPDAFRIDHQRHASLTLVETARLVGAHPTLQSRFLDESLETSPHRGGSLGGTAASGVRIGATVLAHEDMSFETRHPASLAGSIAGPIEKGQRQSPRHTPLVDRRRLAFCVACIATYDPRMLWLLATVLLLLAVTWLGRRLLGERRSSNPSAIADSNDTVVAGDIGNELDLHGVPPREVPELVDAFVDDACDRRERFVRIIHGRGIGVLRRIVRARLARHPRVLAFGDAPPPSGWGATIAELETRPDIERTSRSD
jgi:hypothetical protein